MQLGAMDREKRITRIKKKSIRLIKTGIISLKERGICETAKKTARVLGLRGHVTPKEWAKKPLYTKTELEEQRTHKFEKDIKISIITPVYNAPEDYLRDMMDSVLAQTYPNWELCLADGSSEDNDHVRQICSQYSQNDKRIKYQKLEKNYGIAGNSNACIEMSTGDYIALLDHDDVLHPAALFDVMTAICEKDADFIYTDEAVFESPALKDIISLHFKPDYSIDTLRACNYICHFTVFRRTLIEKCGAFREFFDGAQDHDLILRLTGCAEQIVHIPEVLYYWRAHTGSTAGSAESKPYAAAAGRKAVMCNIIAAGLDGTVESTRNISTHYRIKYDIHKPYPKVSIVIPNCDHIEDLRCCIESIIRKTTYSNYEIIVAENNSTDSDTFEYYKIIEREGGERIRVIKWPGKGFNWSAINNYAIRNETDGDYILLLNNDTEVISSDWIQEMLMYAQRPDVGIVGAMLYYPDETVQHAGVVIGLGGIAGHVFAGCRRGEIGYMGRLCYAQDMSAVTGACMLIRKDVFDEVGGIDESFAVNLNDIDLCLRVREAGYLIVWTPFAELYHYESKSRGYIYDSQEKAKETKKEQIMFRTRWAKIIEEGDLYYNHNLSLDRAYEIRKRKNH